MKKLLLLLFIIGFTYNSSAKTYNYVATSAGYIENGVESLWSDLHIDIRWNESSLVIKDDEYIEIFSEFNHSDITNDSIRVFKKCLDTQRGNCSVAIKKKHNNLFRLEICFSDLKPNKDGKPIIFIYVVKKIIR